MSAPRPARAGTSQTISLRVGLTQRTAKVYLPTGWTKAKPAPVVYAFHPGLATAAGMERITAFNAVADQHGFIVVYPQGTTRGRVQLGTWNASWPRDNSAGGCCGYARLAKVDDVGFFDALQQRLRMAYNADPQRQYVVGYSNGAMLSMTLLAVRGVKIAAAGIVAGALVFNWPNPLDQQVQASPRPVAIFHGGADANIPPLGGVGPEAKEKIDHIPVDSSLPEATQAMGLAQFWAAHNGAAGSPKIVEWNEDAELRVWGDGPREVRFCHTPEGGHTWPGSSDQSMTSGKYGKCIQSVNASAMMWDFFKDKSL